MKQNCVKRFLKGFKKSKERKREFKSKDWCLMRKGKERFPYTWRLCRFAYQVENGEYEAVGGFRYKECIPYNSSTKHLLGTALDYNH